MLLLSRLEAVQGQSVCNWYVALTSLDTQLLKYLACRREVDLQKSLSLHQYIVRFSGACCDLPAIAPEDSDTSVSCLSPPSRWTHLHDPIL